MTTMWILHNKYSMTTMWLLYNKYSMTSMWNFITNTPWQLCEYIITNTPWQLCDYFITNTPWQLCEINGKWSLIQQVLYIYVYTYVFRIQTDYILSYILHYWQASRYSASPFFQIIHLFPDHTPSAILYSF